MIDLEIIRPMQIEGKNNALFSIADFDVQNRLWSGLDANTILRRIDTNLKLNTLLFDLTVHSPSYFWESRFSRQVYRSHTALFNSGKDNVFAFRSEVSDFYEHLEKKRELCPDMPQYKGSKAEFYAKELQSLGVALHREGDISENIAELWMQDLSEKSGNQLDSNSFDAILVENFRDPNKEEKYRRMLRKVVEDRGDLELVRPYVRKKLRGLPEPLLDSVYNRLLYFYLRATSNTMKIDLIDINGNTLYHGAQGISKRNIPLFASVLDIIGIHPVILRMNDIQLLELKRRDEFVNFRSMYLNLVDEAKTVQKNKTRFYWEEFKERAKIKYALFSGIFKRISQILLVVILSDNLPPIQNASVSLLTPEIVDLAIRRLVHVDRTPLNDLKRVVLEQYGKELDNFAEKISSRVIV